MKLRRIARKALAVLGLLLVFGLAKAPFEDGLTRRLVADGLLIETQAANLGGLIGQSAFLAVLGGLRPLVAIYTTLHAFDAWSYREWDTVERDYRIIVTLMPEDIDSWKTGAWHLAYNAAASHYLDESLPEATRLRLTREWVRKGIAFLEAGIEQHPRSSALHKQLADIYREKVDEPCLAARHYKLAMEGDAPQSFLRRFYGYFLARCPGNEQEAHDYLMALYAEGPGQRLPTLIQRIKELEEKLAIPAPLRIPDPDPDKEIRKRFPNAQLP
jgi:hypothetical protein